MRNRAAWKLPPPDPKKVWLNTSLEIQIILACNWRCVSCDQGSQFSSFDFIKRGTMTMEQIMFFIGEMKDKNAYLGRIRIMGGEPTVHPDFIEILIRLKNELVPHHVGKIEVVTNGSRKEMIEKAKELSKVRISGTRVKEDTHLANLVQTPESLGYRGIMCNAPWHCGFSLNAFGYFPCSSGAGIARFEDWMIWQRLTLPTCKTPGNVVREVWPELQRLCDHCYHGLKESDKIKSGTSNKANNTPGSHIASKIQQWKDGKKAEWKTYGQI